MKNYQIDIPYWTIFRFKVRSENEEQALLACCDNLDYEEIWMGVDDCKDITIEILEEKEL